MEAESSLALAQRHYRSGDTLAAVAACRSAVRGGDAPAMRLLGLLLAEIHQLDEASVWTGHALDQDRSPETLCAHGRVLALQRRWPAAAEALREALALRPGFAPARALLDHAEAAALPLLRAAEAHFTAGQFTEAAALFHDASTLRPNDAAIRHALGTALHEAGQPDSAITAYRAALAMAPESLETWHNLASACQATGNLAAALHAFARAYAIAPACFPRIAQELAAGQVGQVWLNAAGLKAELHRHASDPAHDTGLDTHQARPAPPPPPH